MNDGSFSQGNHNTIAGNTKNVHVAKRKDPQSNPTLNPSHVISMVSHATVSVAATSTAVTDSSPIRMWSFLNPNAQLAAP